MGFFKSVGKAVSSAVKKPANIIAPTFMLPAKAIQSVTGLDWKKQLMIGGAAGAGVGALGAMGALGGGAASAGAAGGLGVSGTTAALGQGGAGVMAQSGGVPLLTKVMLGASVGTTLASYFGHKSEQDYRSWFDGLEAQDQQEIQALEKNLSEMQGNMDMRNKAVQKLIDDFPNVAAQQLEETKKQYGTALGAFDESTKMVLDKAASQLSAKFASTGGFNSGSFNQGLADQAYQIAQPRAQLAYDQQMDLAHQQRENTFMGQQMRLSEAEALRNFQQNMLGVNQQQRFSAAQAGLQRRQGATSSLAGLDLQHRQASDQAKGQLFGSLGQTLGTAAMMPMYQQMFNPNRAQAMPNAGPSVATPRLQMPKTAYGGYGA